MTIPRIGDTVEFGKYSGEVDWIGSVQFSFTDHEAEVKGQKGLITRGFRLMVFFKDDFKITQRRKVSRAEIRKKINEKRERNR